MINAGMCWAMVVIAGRMDGWKVRAMDGSPEWWMVWATDWCSSQQMSASWWLARRKIAVVGDQDNG